MTTAVDQVESWLKEFSLKQGSKMGLDEQGCCHLKSVDDECLIIEAPAGDIMYVSSVLGVIYDDPVSAGIMREALIKNLFQGDTMGGSIAFDPSNDAMMLCFSRSVSKMDYFEFENIIFNLFGVSAQLRAGLFGVEDAAQAQASTTLSFGMEGIRV